MKGLTYPSTYHAMKAGPCRVGVCKHYGECCLCKEYGLLRRYAARDVDRIHELRSIVKELADVLDESNKTECEQWCKCSCEHGDDKNGCETMCKKRALVAKAREVIRKDKTNEH